MKFFYADFSQFNYFPGSSFRALPHPPLEIDNFSTSYDRRRNVCPSTQFSMRGCYGKLDLHVLKKENVNILFF